ncbi:MAG TPA: DUF4465 domain-containing protein [Bacteroidaceae bacterium]|nr:DUF4465 domain-containing protein [Bacteroidaceae bacterium]
MSKKFYPFWMALIVTISLSTSMSAQTTLTLSASDVTNCTKLTNCRLDCLNWTDSITGNYNSNTALNVGGGYWCGTYTDTDGYTASNGKFKLSHTSSWGSYWEGLISGANGDTRNFGFLSTDTLHTGSINWVPNQWGVMAGGGISSTSPITVTKGEPYFVAYWGYYNTETNQFDMNNPSVKISLAGDSLFTAHEIYISNHPWPYYGNIYGDGFARPLNQPGDYFKLIIHGVKNIGTEVTDTVILAEYDSGVKYYVRQSPDWVKIPFNSRVWSSLKAIYFTMESTDELVIGDVNYGPNTAVYFCMDKLKVTKTGAVASSSVAVPQAKRAASTKAVEVADYFPVTSYSGGAVAILDENGTVILQTEVKAGEKINLSTLPNGSYHLKHGNKIIPITKKGGK